MSDIYRRYTVDEIERIVNSFTGDANHKAQILAGLLSNPTVLVVPPQPRGRY